MTIKLQNNQKDLMLLVQYLKEVDGDFLIPLSQKTDLESFASKLLTYGHAYVETQDEKNVGLIAFYCNDARTFTASLPILSVKWMARGKGIARKLTNTAISTCRSYGMKRFIVDTVNSAAKTLYKSLGFVVYKTEIVQGTEKEYLELKFEDRSL